MEEIIAALCDGQLHILYVSPERLFSENFTQLLLCQRLPKIYFACIDEAHCVAEWSHNFR